MSPNNSFEPTPLPPVHPDHPILKLVDGTIIINNVAELDADLVTHGFQLSIYLREFICLSYEMGRDSEKYFA